MDGSAGHGPPPQNVIVSLTLIVQAPRHPGRRLESPVGWAPPTELHNFMYEWWVTGGWGRAGQRPARPQPPVTRPSAPELRADTTFRTCYSRRSLSRSGG